MTTTTYKLKGPQARICVASDLHNIECEHIIQEIQLQKPTIILIPGDLCSAHITDDDNKNARYFLRRVTKIAPVFYVRGNHERFYNSRDIRLLKKYGINYLDDSYIKFGEFVIGGLTSRIGVGFGHHHFSMPDMSWMPDYFQQNGFHILLSHQPELYKYIPDGCDLILSGHAHGGQCRFFGRGLFAPGQGLFPKYTKGIYGKMIVSAGLSNTAKFVPRLFNPTELVVIELDNNVD